MDRNRHMRLLVTQTGRPSREFFDVNSLSVFLNVSMRECYTHIFYGFFVGGNVYILIDQMVYNYASGIWVLRNRTDRQDSIRMNILTDEEFFELLVDRKRIKLMQEITNTTYNRTNDINH